ncbi:alpha/beta hydrolase [Leptolyngbya sp. 'hensonii']|uniref:alpha/beta fold hydrolase n=1 Tax=Leptolyngbya sp. 'hensonii' TaxID=1922337 RepID=UPI00094F75C4|nr:alpha/beta hydrolase [Leptolyngbya sp. 'hensonii']OLP18107.1 alpha/beta hydrolase [Leptolyngbya sp. 'hensonii']
MPYIEVRGVDHYYQWITESGDECPSGKPVMVFLHGWAGSARYWESTAQALVDSFDCLLYDLRGFGRTRLPKVSSLIELTYELESYAEDLDTLLTLLNLQRIYLNAHSTGASIATFFLNLYPQRVERAILTCMGIFEYDEKSFKAFHKFGGYVVKFRPTWLLHVPFLDHLFMARFLRRSLTGTYRNRAFLEDFLMADYEAALGTIYTSVSKRAAEVLPQEFVKLQVPTLLISGEHDKIIPPEMGRQAAVLNPKVEFWMMPDTAHFPMLEDPETYLQQIRQFLGKLQQVS